jgi:creatinine amidohydrolase
MLIKWEETTAFDLDLSDSLALLCVGSTEQHSDYLPLGTDSFLGVSLGEAAAKKATCKVVMLPPQRIGFSPHHRAFPGVLTLSQQVMFAYLMDICRSIYASGAEKLLILNSHGGNQTCLQSVVNEIGATLQKRAVLVRYWDLISDVIGSIRESGYGGMGHAGELETSLMMHFRPDLVHTDRIDDRPLASGNEWHHPDMFAANKVYIFKPFNEYSLKGNIGQPIFGTKEKGEKIASLVIDELAKLMDYSYTNGF